MNGQKTKRGKPYARVKVEDVDRLVTVPVSDNKPVIPGPIEEKWQKITDLTAKIFGVSSALVTRFTPENLEVFAASQTKENPYKKDDHDRLGIGMFCEAVAARKESLMVTNTDDSDYWRNNPHAPLGMRSYLGVPIHWHDGELFGTFCVLDKKENTYSETYLELINQFREMLETDLYNLELIEELREKITFNEYRLRDLHHRLKNQFNTLVSYISLKLMDVTEESLEEILTDMKHRIEVMATIHEQISRTDDSETPALNAYIPSLCQVFLKGHTGIDIDIDYEIENITLSIKDTESIGLILSELLSNSVKHAFENKEGNRIHITLKRTGENQIYLMYRDNGRGFPPGFSPETSGTIGMSIIEAFAKQMKGHLNIRTDNGAVHEFELKNIKHQVIKN